MGISSKATRQNRAGQGKLRQGSRWESKLIDVRGQMGRWGAAVVVVGGSLVRTPAGFWLRSCMPWLL